ncbi:Rieske (2Fe-2S) protein [Lapillicoccus jejuensis]|uniref:Cytochrome bc1 complex Rieske iron-sulfur subunit n=1 Tax=Lapillicoccus jejuensis TaxID=402171 RepID=A0A542E4A2_9MICO|nr:Rieske (2Fe-2S) protein [Lapillicoccus jejuensis]TQJ10106.1 Rieske Fe-S protein [Lapillicoccus jejuensis]
MTDSTDQRRTPAPTSSDLPRRTLLRGAGVAGAAAVGVGALAACGSTSDGTRSGSGAGAGSGSGGSSSSAGGSSSSTAAGGSGGASGPSVATADVPVGGGKILDGVVVTQPTQGQFKAFSSVCTHQGCPVTQIQGTSIECMCHGSKFDIATGAVVQGPATQPLAAKTATVEGDKVVVS